MYCYRPLTLQQQTALDQFFPLSANSAEIDSAVLDKLPPDPNPFYTVWMDGAVYLFDELDPL